MKRICCKKSISILLVITVLICTVLCSCAKKQEAVTYENDKGKVLFSLDESFMYFWISMQKSLYQSVADSYENGWNQVIDQDNTTLEDLLMTESEVSAKKLLAVEYMHDKVYQIKLSDEQKDSIKSQTEKLSESFGSKDKLNETLSLYGADTDVLERYFELMLKQNNVYTLFYGENGNRKIAESDFANYFEENYAIVQHIYFDISPVEKEDGTSYSLTDEEISQKRMTAQNVYNQLVSAGADFDTLKAQYNEDVAADVYYPKGFFVTEDGSFPTDFTQTAKKLSVGQIAIVETQDVGIHVIKKLPMDKTLYNLYEDVYMNIADVLTTKDFNEQISEYIDNVSANASVMEQFNASLIPAFSLN